MKKLFFSLALFIPGFAFAQLADSTQRLVHVQGAVNFRDIGGYKTTTGKTVAWGKIFRSADVSKLTNADLDTVAGRNIHTVYDFRGVAEAAAAPDRLPQNTQYQLCPQGSDSIPNAAQMAQILKEGNFLEKFYGNVAPLGERYKPLFQTLLAMPKDEAVMYHCTGGRDRTGIATALILYALQVPQSTIEADYTASNVYLEKMNTRMFKGLQQFTNMSEAEVKEAMELKPKYIQLTFAELTKKYGSLEKFFEKELGVGPKELKTLRAKYTL
ncbi:protein-tyrosine phosphatase [Chitinophaga skermanii]|uniref:Protein-tyrosine phosphatase n=1 Tax=Chitinophaga skermanii TaxID=331697 RepID=A0A327R3T7_9BACT|nr:tyrosine-protein phosphatase [Chitinophaga skermanii]RAJ10875.1 protein-tyrosine phosphatase [Chitinophaga skermanii]